MFLYVLHLLLVYYAYLELFLFLLRKGMKFPVQNKNEKGIILIKGTNKL